MLFRIDTKNSILLVRSCCKICNSWFPIFLLECIPPREGL